MNKLVIVLGVASLAVLSGCKDPKYVNRKGRVQTQPKSVETTPVLTPDVKPVAVKPEQPAIEVAPVEKKAPEKKAPKVAAPAPKPAVDARETAETTDYIVQRGDLLSKISKKYNITMKAILAANPGLSADKIRIGQKIKLPGTVDVGQQTVPAGAIAKPAAKAPKAYAPYTGETKEYVVKSGDCLSVVAKANGLSTRQLKELNGLTSDTLRVNQKIKVPAVAPAKKAAAPAAPAKAASAPVVPVTPVAPVVPVAPVPAETAAPAAVAPEAPAAESAAPAAPAVEETGVLYEALEGDDLTTISLRFGVELDELRSLNGDLSETDELKPGQKIRLPATVQL